MEKQKKQLIVLAVLLIICLGAYFGIRLYNQHVSDDKKKQDEANTVHVAKIAEKDITSFSYTYNNSTLSFTKTNGTWTYDADATVKLDQTAISTMLANLNDVKSTDEIKKYDNTSTYGFDAPALTLAVKTSDKTYTFQFGMTNTMVSGTYMMVDSDTSVYLVDTTIETAFEKTVDELKATESTQASTSSTQTSSTESAATTEKK